MFSIRVIQIKGQVVQQVPQDLVVIKDRQHLPVVKVIKVLQVTTDQKVSKVLRVMMDQKVIRDQKVSKVQKVLRVTLLKV